MTDLLRLNEIDRASSFGAYLLDLALPSLHGGAGVRGLLPLPLSISCR